MNEAIELIKEECILGYFWQEHGPQSYNLMVTTEKSEYCIAITDCMDLAESLMWKLESEELWLEDVYGKEFEGPL